MSQRHLCSDTLFISKVLQSTQLTEHEALERTGRVEELKEPFEPSPQSTYYDCGMEGTFRYDPDTKTLHQMFKDQDATLRERAIENQGEAERHKKCKIISEEFAISHVMNK